MKIVLLLIVVAALLVIVGGDVSLYDFFNAIVGGIGLFLVLRGLKVS